MKCGLNSERIQVSAFGTFSTQRLEPGKIAPGTRSVEPDPEQIPLTAQPYPEFSFTTV